MLDRDTEKRIDERFSRIEDMFAEQRRDYNDIKDRIADSNEHIVKGFFENRRFMWGIMFSVIGVVAAAVIAIIVG
ncbi:MAG: hypothetical protein HFI90_07105 [Clostridia bacterium]|nr:hypothetical protein [Clostridia bacterium]